MDAHLLSLFDSRHFSGVATNFLSHLMTWFNDSELCTKKNKLNVRNKEFRSFFQISFSSIKHVILARFMEVKSI